MHEKFPCFTMQSNKNDPKYSKRYVTQPKFFISPKSPKQISICPVFKIVEKINGRLISGMIPKISFIICRGDYT